MYCGQKKFEALICFDFFFNILFNIVNSPQRMVGVPCQWVSLWSRSLCFIIVNVFLEFSWERLVRSGHLVEQSFIRFTCAEILWSCYAFQIVIRNFNLDSCNVVKAFEYVDPWNPKYDHPSEICEQIFHLPLFLKTDFAIFRKKSTLRANVGVLRLKGCSVQEEKTTKSWYLVKNFHLKLLSCGIVLTYP